MCSKGLGTNLGEGEVGIRVPVWCYMECNRWSICLSSRILQSPLSSVPTPNPIFSFEL